jgi:hypothetical protein
MVDETNELDVPTDSVRAMSMRWNIMVQLIVVFGVTLWLGPVRRRETRIGKCDGLKWSPKGCRGGGEEREREREVGDHRV